MIDLAKLPVPDVVETINYESIFEQRKAALISAMPDRLQSDVARVLQLESEPLTKLLQENCYRELILRQRINDAAKSCFLATACGADLENLSALLGVQRLQLIPAVNDENPIFESDDRLRYRAQMALEGETAAGSRSSYLFHALSASAAIIDATVVSPSPGLVRVYILTEDIPSTDLLDQVRNSLNAEDIRPLSDTVEVLPAERIPLSIHAHLTLSNGPAPILVLDAAEQSLRKMLFQQGTQDKQERLGKMITQSSIIAALHQPGVLRVILLTPISDIICEKHQAIQVDNIHLSYEIRT